MVIMRGTNISGLDLNLLFALDALLAERHVSRAAHRLGTSQPSLSRALADLRRWFGDPLLVRGKRGMTATPRALELEREVRAVLEQIEGMVARRDAFDPKASRRTFYLATPEYAQCVLFPRLLARIGELAPGVSIQVRPWSLAFPEALERGALDLVLSPTGAPEPGLASEDVLADGFCAVVRRGHPGVGRKLGLEAFLALGHISIAPNDRHGGVVHDALAAEGLSRRVTLRIPSFAAAPTLVAASDLCAVMPELFARQAAEHFPLDLHPLPLEVPGFVLRQTWHAREDGDPGLKWLRGEICAVGAALTGKRRKRTAHVDLRGRLPNTL
jgi:DNA-binding transcriptional LysR family regulator